MQQILDRVNSPDDIRDLSYKELDQLSQEIRERIINTVADNGGHLASNLGITDVTIAMHRVFHSPDDTLIFDVGHQAYAHKIITGRKEMFPSLRQDGGISGFTNKAESEHDFLTSGHCGSSVSCAVGVAETNRMLGNDHWAVALIGDGSFTNGMIWEAIEQLASQKLRVMVILNDNGMSISKNVGGMSRYLSRIRTSKKYFGFKYKTKKLFSKTPLIGKGLISASVSVKEFIKRVSGIQTWFEMMGLEYIGPVDGHNIRKLVSVLEEAKTTDCPVIVHVKTKKGYGFAPAEENPESFHSTSSNLGTDRQKDGDDIKSFTGLVSKRMVRLGEENKNSVAITAAMTGGCGLAEFAEKFPDRFLDVGIAEEHAITCASGMAIRGGGSILPVVVIYSTFVQRTFDQMWHDVGIQNFSGNNSHVMLLVSHCGLVAGDGVTHQGIYDVSLLSLIEGVTVYSPDDYEAFNRSFDECVGGKGLTVIRYPKNSEAIYDHDFQDYGEWKLFRPEGTRRDGDAVLVTYGKISEEAVAAAHDCGIEAIVLRRIIPLPDDGELQGRLRNAKTVIVVEETVERGGIGEHLSLTLPGKVEVRAIEDTDVPHATRDILLRHYGIDRESLKNWIRELL